MFGEYTDKIKEIQKGLKGKGIQAWVTYSIEKHEFPIPIEGSVLEEYFDCFLSDEVATDVVGLIKSIELAYDSYVGSLCLMINSLDPPVTIEPNNLDFLTSEDAEKFNVRILEIWKKVKEM